MQVGVTGATGLLGRAICATLTSRGHAVRALGRTPVDGDFVAVDLRDATAVETALQGLDIVVHAAGKTGSQTGDSSNVNMATAVGQAAATADLAIINLSSVAVYGAVAPRVVTESTPCRPVSDYGKSKLDAESSIDASTDKACHLRIGNVWTEVHGAPSKRQRLIRANEVLNVVLVNDVADLVAHLIEAPSIDRPRVINVVRPGLGDVPFRTLYGPVGPLGIPDRFVPILLAHVIRRLRGLPSLPNKVFTSEALGRVDFIYRSD